MVGIFNRHTEEYKQVILVRADLKLPKGKLAAQAAHASVEAVLKTTRGKVMRWRRQGMKKVVLKVKDLDELKQYHTWARNKGIVAELITDAGRTAIKPGTVTCCGIGPDKAQRIDELTATLKMV